MSNNNEGLKRQVGLFGAIMLLVGHVIGSGIFMTPGKVAATAGSFGPNILAWIIAGVCGILCALVYAELAPMMPKAGGAYVYIREAFGEAPAFAYGWSMTFGSFLPLIALLGTGFAMNFAKLLPGVTPIGVKMIASAVIIALVITNIHGVKLGSLIQTSFAIGKLSALILVIVGGFFVLSPENFTSMTTTTVQWGNSFSAAVPALLAFGGYYAVAYMSEEIKDPKRNIPLAMIIGMVIVIVVNILVAIACIGSVGYSNLAGSATPVIDAGKAIFGPVGAIIITIGACVSMLTISVFAGRLLECTVALSLMVLRKKRSDMERPLKMPGYPISTIITILITGYLVCLVPGKQIISGLLLMLTSVPAYFIFKATVKKKVVSTKPE